MNLSYIVGKTIKSVENADSGSERVVFNFTDGTACESYHSPDCCESVELHEVYGNVSDIIGQPILEADSDQDNEGEPKPSEYADSWTWTRQRIRTAVGEVTFEWLGESNGYYGETPYFRITHGEQV